MRALSKAVLCCLRDFDGGSAEDILRSDEFDDYMYGFTGGSRGAAGVNLRSVLKVLRKCVSDGLVDVEGSRYSLTSEGYVELFHLGV